MAISIQKIFTYDLVSSPPISCNILTDEEVLKIKILEQTNKRNLILDKLLED
jgi:hypothetical protein